jgi:hypothetical protein
MFSQANTHDAIVEVFDKLLENDVIRKHRPDISDFTTKVDYLYKHLRTKAQPKLLFDPDATNLIGFDFPPGAT